ncbi:hypothetical protein VTK26DRAFT_6302 [Humicola hyalothermophila]
MIPKNNMDDGLEELAAALVGWRGDNRAPPKTNRHHERQTPEAGSAHSSSQQLTQFSQDELAITVIEDIDTDSALDTSDSFDAQSDVSDRHHLQSKLAPPPPSSKPLPPLPAESSMASPPPGMSCRISRFPFSQPCEVPELMPDQEDHRGRGETPTTADPATPSVAADVFRPLSQVGAPNLELGSFPVTTESALQPKTLGTFAQSARSDVSGSDSLSIIREEAAAFNEDGVSIRTSIEAAFADVAGKGAGQNGFLSIRGELQCRSVSSLASSSSGSADGRRSRASELRRRSLTFLSRIRNGTRAPGEDESLERRSLTPARLSTAPHTSGHGNSTMLAPDGQLPPTNRGSSEDTVTPSFFQRMTWTSNAPPGKDQVFGVELKESLRVAPMKIRISHKGKRTSHRTFPLCVHKCCEFIRRAGGTDGTIFSAPGNPSNIAALRAIFSQPPTYGEDFHFEGSAYTVHDAAGLILLFLRELPKPLISPSVVKSWILLARQEGAIEPPCSRVETGLDFWTEALNRLPTANRNLTKLLLTLFAEVLLSASGRITDADARQFASAVSGALFHQSADGTLGGGDGRGKSPFPRKNVQPTLALAFLIKKRGEYAVSLLGADGGKSGSKSSKKRTSALFLPSTKEMLEWKGAKLNEW